MQRLAPYGCEVFNTQDSSLAYYRHAEGVAALLSLQPFHVVFHHILVTSPLWIVKALFELVLLFLLTLQWRLPRSDGLSDFELAGLDEVETGGGLPLTIDRVPTLVRTFLEVETELAECRSIDALAELEGHEEVEDPVEALLDLAQTHALEVFLRKHCQMGDGGCYHGCRTLEALCPVHQGQLSETISCIQGQRLLEVLKLILLTLY